MRDTLEARVKTQIYYDFDSVILHRKIVFFTNKLLNCIENELNPQDTPPIVPVSYNKRKKKLSNDTFLPFPEIRLH